MWSDRIAAITAGCKLAAFGLRRFESYSLHHIITIFVYSGKWSVHYIVWIRGGIATQAPAKRFHARAIRVGSSKLMWRNW